jgi:hypothetical protein
MIGWSNPACFCNTRPSANKCTYYYCLVNQLVPRSIQYTCPITSCTMYLAIEFWGILPITLLCRSKRRILIHRQWRRRYQLTYAELEEQRTLFRILPRPGLGSSDLMLPDWWSLFSLLAEMLRESLIGAVVYVHGGVAWRGVLVKSTQSERGTYTSIQILVGI